MFNHLNTDLNADGGKGSRLTGTITDEMVESSDSIFKKGQFTQKGLQQFFTPPDVAEFIYEAMGRPYEPAIDLTAGNGALLKPFPRYRRFGVEIDPDQIPDPSPDSKNGYNAINADIQKVYPILKLAGLKFPVVVLNPPFSLMWDDAVLGKHNSALITYLYSLSLLHKYGAGAIIVSSTGLDSMLRHPDGNRIHTVIEVPDMFDNCKVSSYICFYNPHPRPDNFVLQQFRCDREDLMLHLDAVRRAYRDTHFNLFDYNFEEMISGFSACTEEYKRQFGSKSQKPKHEYNVFTDNGKIQIYLSGYNMTALSNAKVLNDVQSIRYQSVNYFALNQAVWDKIVSLQERGLLKIDPKLFKEVESVVADSRLQICPMYDLTKRPQQRLGFLDDLREIKCIKSDAVRGFTEGEMYSIMAYSEIKNIKSSEMYLDKNGELQERKKIREFKVLAINIKDQKFTESKEDLEYILEHFDVPDPGHIGSKFPELIADAEKLLHDIEEDNGFKFKQFQVEDLARLIVKRRAILAWEQGLGKSLAGLTFAEAFARLGDKDTVLLIVPQDLIPQWQREAKKFFNRELTVISDVADALKVRKHILSGGTGWYISYYEAIAHNGRRFELLPVKTMRIFSGERDEEGNVIYTEVDSTEFCPNCKRSYKSSWDPKRGICSKCHYSHVKLKVKPAYYYLRNVFNTIIVDEGTKIKSNNSLISLSVRGMKAKNRLILTGTPIKNFVPDAFWLLWWCIGNNSIRFPFDYKGGYMKFAKDFAVMEYYADEWGSKTGSPKFLPEVSNLSMLWRLLCSSIIRRRKEDTGEPIVDKVIKPVFCPLSTEQKKMYNAWLKGFAGYFMAKYPEKDICQFPHLVERNSAILGQLWKLEFSAVLPAAEPDQYFNESSGANNWTPANFEVIKLASEHVAKGDKVLIGSDLVHYGHWMAEKLCYLGIKAVHLVEETSEGEIKTKNPKKRAKHVHKFTVEDAQVLCASVQSMNLGHNLDCANVVIINGLTWDYATYDQFIARVHRLTSKKPVTVYVIIPGEPLGTVSGRKWDILTRKGASAELAIDGELYEKNVEVINLQEILNDMIEKGLNPEQETVPQDMIHAQFREYSKEYRHQSMASKFVTKSAVELMIEQAEEIAEEIAEEMAEVFEEMAEQQNVYEQMEYEAVGNQFLLFSVKPKSQFESVPVADTSKAVQLSLLDFMVA